MVLLCSLFFLLFTTMVDYSVSAPSEHTLPAFEQQSSQCTIQGSDLPAKLYKVLVQVPNRFHVQDFSNRAG